ncbi:hypothetical protein Mapa_003873 [Marchantia paleacea]|nr:hypothetical protein Mapa_003873 [Marchantia paleacea]
MLAMVLTMEFRGPGLGTLCSAWLQFTTSASSAFKSKSSARSLASSGWCTTLNWNGTPMSRANFSSRWPISFITLLADASLASRMVVRRSCGAPSGRVASDSRSVGHCVHNVWLMSTMCTFMSPSSASRMAPLAATCPKFVHGLASWNLRIILRCESK